MSKVRVQVDIGLCIAAANCTGAAPSLFRINDDSFAQVTGPGTGKAGYSLEVDLNEAQMAELEEAASSCPTKAITVFQI